jgi:hypothetical protein
VISVKFWESNDGWRVKMEMPVRMERYGKLVWETTVMDCVRRGKCMCLHCGRLKIGNPELNCKIAQAFFEICKEHGNAFIMTRCDSWIEKEGEKYEG